MLFYKILLYGILLSALIEFRSGHKVIDLIQFNGDILVELRFNYLIDVVDLFAVVEGTHTFAGIRKETLYTDTFNVWFKKLEESNKLLKIIYDDFPSSNLTDQQSQNNNFLMTKRESFQKDFAVQKILQYMGNESFVLISSDADEIPKLEIISYLIQDYEELDSGAYLDMVNLFYNFKWAKNSKWQRAMVLNDRLLRKSISNRITLHELRMIGEFTVIKNAGWHCSFCMSAEKILHKISLSHSHLSETHFKSSSINSHMNLSNINSSWIKHCIEYGIDLFQRKDSSEQLRLYDGKQGYPIPVYGNVTVDILRDLQNRFDEGGNLF